MAKVQVKIRGAFTVEDLETVSNEALREVDERLLRGVNYTMMSLKGHGEAVDRPYYICTITYVKLNEQEAANFGRLTSAGSNLPDGGEIHTKPRGH